MDIQAKGIRQDANEFTTKSIKVKQCLERVRVPRKVKLIILQVSKVL